MKKIKIGGVLEASDIALGCARVDDMDEKKMCEMVETALGEGIDFFDTADIYGGGRSEELLGAAVRTLGVRDKVTIQTKCAIRKGLYDFSYEHIVASAEASLKRLGVDCIDVLLLHRPDALMEPEEVARAFNKLYIDGKVKNFGVSNQNPYQITLLQKFISHKIIANQLQFSIAHTGMIDSGFNVNTTKPEAVDRDGFILDYCRLHDITIQAWSPLQYGFFEGTFIGNREKYAELNETLEKYARLKGAEKTAIAFAWILRHPAKIQAIAGTTNPGHLKQICRASEISLTREEWYELYLSAGNKLP
jgi:predicted oxidoreductase